MENVNRLGAGLFVPQFPARREAPAPRLALHTPAKPAPTLDALRRGPRPPLAWEAAQCARNLYLHAVADSGSDPGDAGIGRQPSGWTARGL